MNDTIYKTDFTHTDRNSLKIYGVKFKSKYPLDWPNWTKVADATNVTFSKKKQKLTGHLEFC